MLELKETLCILVRLLSNLNMVEQNVELMRRLKCVILTAGTIASGVPGPMMDVNFLALPLLELPVKTDRERLAKFNPSR
jgi:hypothetical protein